MTVVDMTKGVYRRVYAGFIRGKRICSVSMEAEAWFWRLQAAADDFGHLPADVRWLQHEAGGGRDVSRAKVERWNAELIAAGLLVRYESSGDTFLEIVGFTNNQPANRNGKRIKRFPVNPGESRCIQVNPESSQQSLHADSYTDDDDDSDSESLSKSKSVSDDDSDAGAVAASPPSSSGRGQEPTIGGAVPPAVEQVWGEWAGHGCNAADRRALAGLLLDLEANPVRLPAGPAPPVSFVIRAIQAAVRRGALWSSHGAAMGWLRGCVQRCRDQACWPEEFPGSTNGHAAKPSKWDIALGRAPA